MFKPIRLLTWPLEMLGIRRRVVYLSFLHWEKINWVKLFTSSVWMKLLYKFDDYDFDGFMKQGNYSAVEAFSKKICVDNYKVLAFDGLNLWEMCKTSILAAAERPVIETVGEKEMLLIRHFYKQAIVCLTAAQKVFDQTKPVVLLATQGCPHIIRPAVEEARRRGIRTVATEMSFSKNHFFCDAATGMIVNRHSGSRTLGDWFKVREFTDEQRQSVREFVANLDKAKSPEHQTNGIRKPDKIREHLNIPIDKKIAVYIGQVLTDASIIMDSPVFPDPVALIQRLREFFAARSDWILVVRLHPKEEVGHAWVGHKSIGGLGNDNIAPDDGLPYRNLTLRMMQKAGVHEGNRLRIVSSSKINTTALLSMANLGITCNSQAGFEMALRYKPVVVVGDAFYARKGFTFDVAHQVALEATLDTALSVNGMADREKLLVDGYTYALLKTSLFRRDLLEQQHRLFKEFDGSCSWGLRELIMRKALDSSAKLVSCDPTAFSR